LLSGGSPAEKPGHFPKSGLEREKGLNRYLEKKGTIKEETLGKRRAYESSAADLRKRE